MNIRKFATDEVAEVDGVWKDIGSGASIKVAREQNANYVKVMRKETEKYTTSQWSADPSEEESNDIRNRVLSKTVLVDWKGIQEEEGVDVPYSTDKAFEWLSKYKDFKKIVLIISMDIANYRHKRIKEAQDNIKK